MGTTDIHDEDVLRARLAAIVDSSDDAIVSKTLDGVITSWNGAAERLFGYSASEAIGQQIFLIIPDDRVAEENDVLARLRRGERLDHFETVRQAEGGRRIPLSFKVWAVRDATGTNVRDPEVGAGITGRVVGAERVRRAAQGLEGRGPEPSV